MCVSLPGKQRPKTASSEQHETVSFGAWLVTILVGGGGRRNYANTRASLRGAAHMHINGNVVCADN